MAKASPTPAPPNGLHSGLGLLRTPRKLPTRLVVHGLEGSGKTSLASQIPGVVFMMIDSETGLETLIEAGQVPEVDHFPPEITTWNQVKLTIQKLIVEQHDKRALAIDTLNSAERLCFAEVCKDKFSNDFEKFGAFGRGVEAALAEWNQFLGLLERLRESKNMSIVLLAHTKVATFKNPEGPDYDRFVPDMSPKTWGLTYKWCDVALFAQFETFVSEDRKFQKPKGTGGQTRILCTERTAAFDAKNRLGLPAEIECGTSPTEAWSNLHKAMREAKTKVTPAEQ